MLATFTSILLITTTLCDSAQTQTSRSLRSVMPATPKHSFTESAAAAHAPWSEVKITSISHQQKVLIQQFTNLCGKPMTTWEVINGWKINNDYAKLEYVNAKSEFFPIRSNVDVDVARSDTRHLLHIFPDFKLKDSASPNVLSELYLWHATSAESAASIAMDRFRKVGIKNGDAMGEGIYLGSNPDTCMCGYGEPEFNHRTAYNKAPFNTIAVEDRPGGDRECAVVLLNRVAEFSSVYRFVGMTVVVVPWEKAHKVLPSYLFLMCRKR